MSKLAPIPAYSWPGDDGQSAHFIGYWCPWFEDVKFLDHSEATRPALGSLHRFAATGDKKSGSPFAEMDVVLRIVGFVANAGALRPYRAPGIRGGDRRFWRKLYNHAPYLRKVFMEQLFGWPLSQSSVGLKVFGAPITAAVGLDETFFAAAMPVCLQADLEAIGTLLTDWKSAAMPSRSSIYSSEFASVAAKLCHHWTKRLPVPRSDRTRAEVLAKTFRIFTSHFAIEAFRKAPAGLVDLSTLLDKIETAWSLPRSIAAIRVFEALAGTSLDHETVVSLLEILDGIEPVADESPSIAPIGPAPQHGTHVSLDGEVPA